jgi:DNA-binding response OmpR family regulator
LTGPAPIELLVVSADPRTSLLLAEAFSLDGFAVSRAHCAEHARVMACGRRPALAILGDLGSARGALDLLCEIRASGATGAWDPGLATIVLGCTPGGVDALRAFEAGADDFFSLSAGLLELGARVRALLRRAALRRAPRLIEVGQLSIDVAARSCSVAGIPLLLRRMEFALLLHLARDPDRVFTRGELLAAVWGYRAAGATRTVDSHASRLRRRLGAGAWVVGVRNVGYRLR